MTFTDTAWPKAVLWDMDGTLIDSEPYWMAVETPLVERFGGTWTHEDALQLIGNDLEGSARILQGRGVEMAVPEIVDYLTDSVLQQLTENGVPFRPGAWEFLRELRERGVKTALVTMSRHRMAAHVAGLIEFDAFDVIFGGDDVERPKPYPDPYLAGARALDVDIRDCVAIEDSPTGLRAAVSSGAATIGVPNLIGLDDLGADVIWETLAGRTFDHAADVWRAAHSRTGT